MKYLAVYKTDKGEFKIKINFGEGKEKWASTSEAVTKYAKANFKQDEEVDLEYTEKDGQYSVSKIMKKGQKGATPTPVETKTETTKSTDYTCEDCGTKLKDGKYKKCFTCNKKNPAPRKEYTGGGGQRDAVGQSIEKQVMMKASAMAVGSAFVGQIGDADSLANMIITVYEKLLAKLTE